MAEPGRIVNTMHKMHCSAVCLLRLHLDRDGIRRITSAGDIPRLGSEGPDAALDVVQRRACARGYAEIDHNCSLDRVRYPMRQTGERGNVRGFRRISWDAALDEVAQCYDGLLRSSQDLGYLPVLEKGGIAPWIGPHLAIYGNPSSGNVNGAMFAALGAKNAVHPSPAKELFKSEFVVVWASDPVISLPHLAYLLIKAREAGVRFTIIDSRYTQSANVLGTGTQAVPAFICVRPGSDAVLAAAMANVIHRRNLHDERYIREHCFGYFSGDQVTSNSTGRDPVSGEPYRGRTYAVPTGCSFVEYLDGLELEHGGYGGVLDWAASVTGMPRTTIESLACAYARSRPAFIFSPNNGGAQRTRNGLYFSWLLIALSAMTGHIGRPGGGFGEVATGDGYEVDFPQSVPLGPHRPILVSRYKLADLIQSGRDGRTPEQLRADILAMNGIDIGAAGRIRIDAYVKGGANGNDFNQTQHINRKRLAWNRLGKVITYERHFSPTAAWSDLVLPATSNFEDTFKLEKHRFSARDVFVLNGPLDAPGEARTDDEINRLIAARLGIAYPEAELDHQAALRRQWAAARIDPAYPGGSAQPVLPAFEELVASGNYQLPIPVGSTVNPFSSIPAGTLTTETGRINFYSQFLAERGRAALGVYRAQHVALARGPEDFVRDGGFDSASGRRYTLQLISPHGPSRAVATYDNVPALRHVMPHTVDMHPADAGLRALRDGGQVYVYNDFGCMRIELRINPAIRRGVVSVDQGAWHRASEQEFYDAYFDDEGNGTARWQRVAVDIAGSVNVLTEDLDSGLLDPFIDGMGMNANAIPCEVSATLPVRKARS
jgi:anaerobic dimethyl sulfoxide reductase subunit A